MNTIVTYAPHLLGYPPSRPLPLPWHTVGNKMFTLITNVLYDTTLTDMETCYKVFTVDIARKLRS